MSDFRAIPGRPTPERMSATTSLVGALIQQSDEIGRRFESLAANLPYSNLDTHIITAGVSQLAANLGGATWKRIGREVPSYSFAEALGRSYAEIHAPLGSLLLHWQIFRRAVHLVLADRRIRTGHGDEDLLRQSSLMNYTIDWAIEASLVGYLFARRSKPGGSVGPD